MKRAHPDAARRAPARSTRRCISSAALLVNVRARICARRHALREQVGDAVGDDPRLAAARPGEHQAAARRRGARPRTWAGVSDSSRGSTSESFREFELSMHVARVVRMAYDRQSYGRTCIAAPMLATESRQGEIFAAICARILRRTSPRFWYIHAHRWLSQRRRRARRLRAVRQARRVCLPDCILSLQGEGFPHDSHSTESG